MLVFTTALVMLYIFVTTRTVIGRQTYAMSRPLIELALRRQVERLTNVKVQGRCRVLNIIGESNTGAATGICYRTPKGNVEALQSDVIIDASGNGSLTLEFLKASGRRMPEENLTGVAGTTTPAWKSCSRAST